MVCFDGGVADHNTVIFCDGCNSSVHQACYGITEIPEGDFFCDRCQAIQWFASECDDWHFYYAKDAVKCALCPLHHGGLKPTTNGKWVHLSCAIWAPDSVILDLDDMSPVDISKVITQDSGTIKSDSIPDQTTTQMSTPSCQYCGLSMGYITSCSGCDENGPPCGCHFHPLCAWFQGLYFNTKLEDPSFQAGCLEFFFFDLFYFSFSFSFSFFFFFFIF